jgi:16S rRNA (cytosine967-C5)-methyltransferase
LDESIFTVGMGISVKLDAGQSVHLPDETMQYLFNHIQTVLNSYQGNPPLSAYLKNYFRSHTKLGSRDRKAITTAVYSYYRAKRFTPSSDWQAITKAVLLSQPQQSPLLLKLLDQIQPAALSASPLEPLPSFSGHLDPITWFASMQTQPYLFIRVRRDTTTMARLLQEAGVVFDKISEDCWRLPNGCPVDKLLPADKYVVQDWASQQSIRQVAAACGEMPARVWDVCSGAGGKSIFLKDHWRSFSLLATDIRERILQNLKTRFQLYQIDNFKTLVLDTAHQDQVRQKLGRQTFDLVLCDVPCSGSGTWARTPEQFHFFKQENLQHFQALQYPIVANAGQYLKPGGLLAYITCSVFEAENEAVTARLQATCPELQLIHQGIVDGIALGADCMYMALLSHNTAAS